MDVHDSFRSTAEPPLTDPTPLMGLIVHSFRTIYGFGMYSGAMGVLVDSR